MIPPLFGGSVSIDATDFIPNNDPFNGINEDLKTSIWNGYQVSRKSLASHTNSHPGGLERLLNAAAMNVFEQLVIPLTRIGNKNCIQKTCSITSWMANIFETIGKGMIDPDLLDQNSSLSIPERSSRFSTNGDKAPHLGIGGINGINISWDEAHSHTKYINQFAPGHSIDWIYNHSHGIIADLAEVFLLNYLGFSPNTGQLLKETWIDFHHRNTNRPNAKYLQFCHSQGAIHVRNALVKLPKEICSRIIVVAIAPAVAVPKELCFQSFNYVCKNDIIPYGELCFAGAINPHECKPSDLMKQIMKYQEEFIFLKPNAAHNQSMHFFQHPIYAQKIRERIDEYLQNDGEYLHTHST